MDFNPKFTITLRLLNNIKEITRLTTLLNNKRFSTPFKMQLEKNAMSLSVHSSTSIEGNPLPLTEVKLILKNKPENLRDSEKEVINYNDALIYLRENIGNLTGLNKKLVLNVYSKVMKDLLQSEDLKNYRKASVVVNNPRSGEAVYLPPDAKDVEDLMQSLVGYVNKNKEKIDPIIIAGLFHKQFVVIHPFIDGNGRTVRLLTKFLLADMGLDTFNLFSFENYYNKNVTKYFNNVGVLGNYYDIKDNLDFTSWLEYFTDGIIDELVRVSKELEKFSTDPGTSLKDHDRKVLKHIEEYGYITDSGYSKLTDRAKATRALDFEKLRKLGLIKRKGKGRATYYTFD